MFKYVKESYNELVNKVSWPTFPQLQNSTVVVMVASVVFAIIVSVMDFSFQNMMQGVYNVFGSILH